MIRPRPSSATDPRLTLDEAQRQALSLRGMPIVARQRRASDGLAVALGVLGALALGAFTLLGLSGQRTQATEPAAPVAVVPDVAGVAFPVADVGPAAPSIDPVGGEAAPVAAPAVIDPNRLDPGQSRAMPLVFDSTEASATAAGAEAIADAGATEGGLNADELFAVRSAGDAPPLARSTALGDARNTVVQGTILPAVLETAVNSDLPGFTRAIISRDVRGFDGRAVLIPRGSRLVGQYKSGLAAGQSRAYIMWTRLIRPDGVSVQLGSPVMDAGGEIGLPGDVNRHFWQRFGASILLSVVSGAAGALGDGSSVVVASSGAQSAAGVALETSGKIPPTIRVPLGTPIQVFVARDLDFSGHTATTFAGTDPLSANEKVTP